jgi:hypothetical protein
MTPLTPQQQLYLDRRRRQIRWWFRLGWIPALVVLGLYAWLWNMHPLYVDPALLLQKLRTGGVADIEVARLAALGNLAFAGCALLLVSLVLLTYAAMWTEATTIRQLTGDTAPPTPGIKLNDPSDTQEAPSRDQPQA